MLGVPKGYQPTPEDTQVIRAVSELQFPLKPRKQGAIFDGFVSNLVADRFPLRGADRPHPDRQRRRRPLGPAPVRGHRGGRIPGAKLVTIDRGGHLFLGHDAQVRTAIGSFIESVTQPERRPT